MYKQSQKIKLLCNIKVSYITAILFYYWTEHRSRFHVCAVFFKNRDEQCLGLLLLLGFLSFVFPFCSLCSICIFLFYNKRGSSVDGLSSSRHSSHLPQKFVFKKLREQVALKNGRLSNIIEIHHELVLFLLLLLRFLLESLKKTTASFIITRLCTSFSHIGRAVR